MAIAVPLKYAAGATGTRQNPRADPRRDPPHLLPLANPMRDRRAVDDRRIVASTSSQASVPLGFVDSEGSGGEGRGVAERRYGLSERRSLKKAAVSLPSEREVAESHRLGDAVGVCDRGADPKNMVAGEVPRHEVARDTYFIEQVGRTDGTA